MPLTPPPSPYTIDTLRQILRDLRDPVSGCPWDREQSFASIAPYTIEEAYEVADAIERGDMPGLADELGDLLLQVVYHSQIASEAAAFDMNDVIAAICTKMIRRHPHVYGDAAECTVAQQTGAWEEMKATERSASTDGSALAGIARTLPAMAHAEKLQKRAARTGFDWRDADGPRAKIAEELAECDAAATAEELHHEIGDLLFSVVNWSRHLAIDPEAALRDANRRFEGRFRSMETASATPLSCLDNNALEALWSDAKKRTISRISLN